MHPGSAHLHLHRALPEVALGREARALEQVRLAHELLPDAAAPAIHLHVAYGYARLGQADEARRALTAARQKIGNRFVDPAAWAWAALVEGDRGRALDRLGQAVEKPEFRQEVYVRGFLEENAWADPILEEAEFLALRERLDLTG